MKTEKKILAIDLKKRVYQHLRAFACVRDRVSTSACKDGVRLNTPRTSSHRRLVTAPIGGRVDTVVLLGLLLLLPLPGRVLKFTPA